ncbi:putative late blight resistance protein homolog R1A-4 [Coffea arabica]|uniref:Late blight resistance protein homolog R1B-16 n=1 Tax=Coffea arabica TaxID=13443 RepID=A0A6P6TVR0_COFAR|nr:putative late blight resistance protein homolog R1B-16 [Coffea arabica]XP_027082430.1 putative late blight resistance protein homolog R1B-16 [Coffea arabica]
MGTSNYLYSLLETLENPEIERDLDVVWLKEFRPELRLLRTYLLCAREWSRDLKLSESHGNSSSELASVKSSMSGLEAAINEYAQELRYTFLRSKRSRVGSKNLMLMLLDVEWTIKTLRQQIGDLFITLRNCSFLQTFCRPVGDGVTELVDSVLKNLTDFVRKVGCDDRVQVLQEPIKDLHDKLSFLRNLIRFVILRGVAGEQRQLVDVLSHIKIVAINAAGLTYMYWDDGKDGEICNQLQVSISELLQKVNPTHAQVREIYIQVLIASNSSWSSYTLTDEMHNQLLGDTVDSLLGNLWELLKCTTSLMASRMDQISAVWEGLRFLRTIIKNQQQKFGQMYEKVKEIVPAAVNEAGFVMSSLYMHEMEVDLLIFPLQDKIRIIEAELAANSTEAAAFDSPSIMVEEFKRGKAGLLEINNNEHSSEALKAAKLSTVLRSQGTPSMFNQEVVGYKDEAEQLICQLTRGSKQLDIVSIVGMPGQGKTTLANKVYRDALITCHFHVRVWCCISQVYQKRDVLLEILACIEPERFDWGMMHEDDLAEVLYRSLKGNRYLQVLDDIWDIKAWNCLERSFPNDANGSRILLTSRIHNLALEAKPTAKSLPLRQLTDDESWELLQKKLAERNGHPPVKSVLGRHIAKGCKGLPLTIVIIAGVLATLDQDGWEEVAEMLSSKVVCGTEQCMDILELSYIHLPKHLKPCFLYFGAFLENQEIPIWRLMRMWIAEGFVHKTDLKSLEDTAEDYIMDLIGRSLVIVSKQKSTGTVKACRIHDLLHEFCVTKAKEQKFIKLRHCYAEILNFDEPSSTHRLFVYTNGENFERSRLFCPLLRTLLVSAQSHEPKIQSNFHFVVRIFKLLGVLDFVKINLGSIFPGEIALLVQLKFLAVRGTMK